MMGMDPRKMEQMMKQLGVKTRNLNAKRVVIEEEGGQNTVIDNPSVVEIDMRGQKSFQISGNVRSETGIPKEDIQLVVAQTGASEEQAKKALEDAGGDIAEAILKLKDSSI